MRWPTLGLLLAGLVTAVLLSRWLPAASDGISASEPDGPGRGGREPAAAGSATAGGPDTPTAGGRAVPSAGSAGGQVDALRAGGAQGAAGPEDDPADASIGGTPGGDAAAAVAALLRARQGALRAGDRESWLAPVDAGAPAYRDRQAQLFDLLRQLPLHSWSWEVRGVSGLSSPAAASGQLDGERLLVQVALRYRLAGYDSAEVLRTRSLVVVRRDARYWLVGDENVPAALAQQHDPWELGPTAVVQGRASLVLGRRPVHYLRQVAAAADVAVDRVDAVWRGDWSRRVVVVVPATDEEMGTLLGTAGGGAPDAARRQLAALTNGHVAPGGSIAGAVDRVVLQPDTFPRLSELGRLVVLTHEVTHVATRSATAATTPLWLSEGLADYIGYRDSGVPVAVAAAGLLREVRAGASSQLPEPESFAATDTSASSAYEGAWLACRLVAERYGEARLLQLHAAGSRPATDQRTAGDTALRDVLGLSRAQFVADWRAYLARLAT